MYLIDVEYSLDWHQVALNCNNHQHVQVALIGEQWINHVRIVYALLPATSRFAQADNI